MILVLCGSQKETNMLFLFNKVTDEVEELHSNDSQKHVAKYQAGLVISAHKQIVGFFYRCSGT